MSSTTKLPPLNRAQIDLLRNVAQLGIGNAATLGAQRVSHRRVLQSLAARGLVRAITVRTAARGDTHYRITAAGTRALALAPRTHGAVVPSPVIARPLPPAQIYTGAELRPYEGRPGAMDAFALPSRMGRRLVWRDGRVEGLNEICTQAAPAERGQLSGE